MPFFPFQAGSGLFSVPEGAQGCPLLLPLLELFMGSVQIFEHLQQADSCLSVPGQGIGTDPCKGDNEPRRLSQA